ncbi:hypothetical protein DV735_g80, partial [Chaetothyriales sp. CBS 134920]
MASTDVRFQQAAGQVTQPFVGARGPGPNYGAYAGPNPGPYGGPNAGQYGGPNAGPYGGPNAGPYGGPNAGPSSGPNAGPYAGPNAGPYNGPNLGPSGAAAAAYGTAAAFGGAAAYGGGSYGGGVHHPVESAAHRLGERLTGGKQRAGYLAAYLHALQSYPLRTKMLTSGALAALQELIASWLAHDRSRNGHYLSSRVPKMAIYGAFISAPTGHFLIGLLQFFFADRTSLRAKILQILTSNLIVAPIQNTIYLASMAVIAGARTWHQIRATIRAGFLPVMRVSWITSPIALAFAQNFLPEETWVPFFNIVAFCIGTYINTHTKKKRLAALRRKHYGDGRPPTVGPTGRPDEGY